MSALSEHSSEMVRAGPHPGRTFRCIGRFARRCQLRLRWFDSPLEPPSILESAKKTIVVDGQLSEAGPACRREAVPLELNDRLLETTVGLFRDLVSRTVNNLRGLDVIAGEQVRQTGYKSQVGNAEG